MSPASPIVEEIHASRFFAMLFCVLGAVEVAFAMVIGVRVAQIGAAIGGVLSLIAATGAWSGFRYSFSQAGVEIRVLGFRLRSIPAGQISQYVVDSWNPWFAYGIRGFGKRCAYVWGRRGVRIYTDDGMVFLGHDEPQRIVHDLDVIKQFAGSRAVRVIR